MITQCFILRLFKKSLTSTVLILFFFTWINLNVGSAQVTIGSSQLPAKGALLDIKSQTPSIDNVTSDKGGLILPRVKLKNLATLEPFIPTTDPEWINATTSKIRENHKGLLVYNLTTSASFQEGVYFWDGTSWKLNDAKVNNGLTVTNNIIGLGGALNRATTISSTGTNSLNFTGTAPFTVANPTTINGTLKITSGTPALNKVLTSDAIGNATWTAPNYESTTANNGVVLSGKTVQLGGALTKVTTVTASGANNLNIAGTAPFTVANPTTINGILKITSGTPALNKVLTSDATGNATWTAPNYESTTANNGVVLSGKTVQLGGALTKVTTITAPGANNLNIAGTAPFTVANPTTINGTLKITSGTPALNKVLTSDATGNATWTAPNYESTTANNGVALSGKTVQLGGALTKVTTVTASGANNLNFTGTAPFTVANPTTINGTLKITSGTPALNKVLTSDATGNATWTAPNYESTTANNGVVLSGKTVQLGGALTKVTTVTASGANNLNIAGTAPFTVANPTTINGTLKITSGTPALNKVLTSDATGNATWMAPNYESTTANNGVALSGKTVQLGGALTKVTTITASGANNLNIATTGTAKFNVNSALSVQNNKVTIGSQNTSPIAALLNLQTQVDSSPTQGGVNANGGLMLPRVLLVENNSLKPFIPSGGTATEKAAHKGMMVYNIGGNGIDAGQKTWDGQRWSKVITDIPPAPIIRVNYYYMKETVFAKSSSPQETEKNVSITWMVNNVPSQDITIQEAGSYAFMVRIYGEGMPKIAGDTRVNRCVTYYTLMVNGKKVDVQEMNDAIASPLHRLSGTPVLIGDNLKVGDKIQIKFGFWVAADNTKEDLLVKDISLISRSTSVADMRADNTTMVMWKL